MDARTAVAAFVLLVACLGPIVSGENEGKINVDVYYESLCPDSVRFITKKLAPAYPGLKDFVHLNLVPFGKASWTKSDGEAAKFDCQHGPQECYGNRAQACALEEIAASFGPADAQDKSVEVVNCVMGSRSPATSVPECAERKGLSAESVQRIQECTSGGRGEELLIAHGVRTKKFEQPISFIPSIAINGRKSSEAFNNFKRVVCQLIREEEKPAVCNEAPRKRRHH